jgi:hypothetical protein
MIRQRCTILEDIDRLRTLMEIEQPDMNEGWKDVAIGGVLFLTTILPMTVLSQKEEKTGNDTIVEYVVTNKLLSVEEIKDLMHRMFANGFYASHLYSFSEADIDRMPEGKYLMVNAEGLHIDNINSVLSSVTDAYRAHYGMRFSLTYKLYKESRSKIEGIEILLVESYASMNKQQNNKKRDGKR